MYSIQRSRASSKAVIAEQAVRAPSRNQPHGVRSVDTTRDNRDNAGDERQQPECLDVEVVKAAFLCPIDGDPDTVATYLGVGLCCDIPSVTKSSSSASRSQRVHSTRRLAISPMVATSKMPITPRTTPERSALLSPKATVTASAAPAALPA